MTANFVNEIRQRTYRYYYEDGLVEMAVGLQFAVIGLALWAAGRFLSGVSFAMAISLGLMAVILGGIFGVKWAVTALKERITSPRTGKVTYRQQPDRGRWRMVLAVAMIALLAFFLPENWTSSAVMVGTVLTVMLVYMGYRVGLARLQLAAVVPLAGSVLMGYLGWEEVEGTGLVFMASGLALLLMGAFVLSRFLRENPVQAEGA